MNLKFCKNYGNHFILVKNSKSPKSDKVPNYWPEAFPATHIYIKNIQDNNRKTLANS